jgi:hypothetical protein
MDIHLQSFRNYSADELEDSFFEYYSDFMMSYETNYSRLHIYQRICYLFDKYIEIWIMTRRSLPISKEIFNKWMDIVFKPIQRFVKEIIHHGITLAEIMYHIEQKQEFMRYQNKILIHEHYHGFIYLQKIVILNSWRNKNNDCRYRLLQPKHLRY